MEILGLSPDVVLIVLLLVGWFVLMRFVLPRMGVSTWMGEACNVASPREEEEEATDWARPVTEGRHELTLDED